MPFQPGQSGNPDGRPAVAREFRERCQGFMEAEGWRRLNAMARGRGPFAYQALSLIAAYAYGKPSQPITGPDNGPIQLAVSALVADIADAAGRLATAQIDGRTGALALGGAESAESEDAAGDLVYVVDSGGPRLGQDEDRG